MGIRSGKRRLEFLGLQRQLVSSPLLPLPPAETRGFQSSLELLGALRSENT